MIFRENAAHGEWCAILLPLALLVSHSQNLDTENPISLQIILLAIAMTVFSFNLGEHLKLVQCQPIVNVSLQLWRKANKRKGL